MYQYLEPLYNDYRKMRLRQADGAYVLTHMDELVDEMLRAEYMFDIALPRIPNRCGQSSRVSYALPSCHDNMFDIALRRIPNR